MLTLREFEKPSIKRVVFECDDIIHPKLEQYELSKCFLNRSNTTVFVGKQGSGKTSLLVGILLKLYKKCFETIFVFMPASSRRSLKKNVFDEYLPADQLYEELNPDTMHDVYERVKVLSGKGMRTLIIFDDVQKSLKDTAVLSSLKNIIANQRHLKVVNLIMLQNYFALDRSMRELITNVVLFKLGKSQTEKVFEELIETNREKFDAMRDFIYREPHDWAFINLATQRIFRMWDEVIYKDEGENSQQNEIETTK